MKKYIYILLIIFLSFPTLVNAATTTYCIKENCATNNTCGAYTIKYDDKNPNVKLTLIADAIRNKQDNVTFTTATGVQQFDFKANRYAFKCTVEGENFNVCPSSNNKDAIDDLLNKYLFDKNKDANFNITFDESTGKFDIAIVDKSKFYEKFVFVNAGTIFNKNTKQEDASYIDTSKVLNFSNPNILSKTTVTTKDGKYVDGYKINDVTGVLKGGNKVLIEVYEKTGDCKGTMIGAFLIDIPALDTIKVSNPALSNPALYGCNNVINYVPNGMSSEEAAELANLKKAYIPECYNSQINYTERNNLKTIISSKYIKLQELFKYYNASAPISEIVCNEQKTQAKFAKYIKKDYWAATVSEEYSVKGDSAKLVKAGNGFEYQTEYSVTRYVTIIQIDEPSMPEQCETTYGHMCYWPGGSGSDGGPNEDFDSCILECDNGKYTQSCINSCYSKVYGVDRDLSFIDKFTYDNSKKSNILKISDCTTDHGNSGTTVDHGDDDYCVSDYCEENGWCDEWEDTGPDGCSDDPQADYDAQVDDANSELEAILSEVNVDMTANEYVGNYTYKITDTYLKTADGQQYVFTVDNLNSPKLYVETNTPQVIQSASGTPSYDSNYNFKSFEIKKVDIKVNLPLSYISKVNSDVAYKTTGDSKAYKVDYHNSKFESITNFNFLRFYNKNNERKYYTSILSDSTNIKYKEVDNKKYIYLLPYKEAQKNIHVTSSNVGEGKFGSNIKCYYGLHNNFYNPPCTSPSDCETSEPTGIQYIYRPIDLDDVFPNNRNPRFNWTGTLNRADKTENGAALYAKDNYMEYDVDPIKLTQEIEEKGENIYTDSGEYDYEFVLTKENIRNIRNYNKTIRDYNDDCIEGDNDSCHNYLDYNMNCYKNSQGKEICTSYFLDNIDGNSGSNSGSNFITYSVSGFNTESRKRLAGCNNAYNRECVDIITR